MENGKNMILKKFKLSPIAGDASFRKFYRKKKTKQNKSSIFVLCKKEKFKNLLVYSAINEFLLKNNVKAPKLLSENYREGFIEIEDFCEVNFYNVLSKNKKRLKIYKRLVNLLIKIQKIKIKNINNFKYKNYRLKKYSLKELHKESDLFFDWYLPLIMKKEKIINLKRRLRKELQLIYKNLQFNNNVFVHRDFHVSNLMKINNKIGVIDSQDAIVGNLAYDLVSLIDDVRIKTSKKLKDDVLKYYISKNCIILKKRKKDFLNDFNILSIQRSMKIIGIFSRLYKRDRKRKYLKLIPYTWELLELRLKDQMFSKIKSILDEFIVYKKRKKINFYAN